MITDGSENEMISLSAANDGWEDMIVSLNDARNTSSLLERLMASSPFDSIKLSSFHGYHVYDQSKSIPIFTR